MATNTKDVLVTNDPFSYWANDVKNDINQNTPLGGNDVLITRSNRGTTFSIHPKFKYNPNYLRYVGDWNISASYDPHDVVSVFDRKLGQPDKTAQQLLEDQLNSFFPDGFHVFVLDENTSFYTGQYHAPSGATPTVAILKSPEGPPPPGTYVCVSPVPSLNFVFDAIDADFMPSVSNDPAQLGALLPYVRFTTTNYFPMWPEPPITAELSIPTQQNHQGGQSLPIGE